MFSEQVDSLRFLQRFLVFSPLTVLSIASWSHHTYQSSPQLYFSDAVSSFWVQSHKIVAKSCWIFKLANGGLARLPSATDDTTETTHFNGLKEISQNLVNFERWVTNAEDYQLFSLCSICCVFFLSLSSLNWPLDTPLFIPLPCLPPPGSSALSCLNTSSQFVLLLCFTSFYSILTSFPHCFTLSFF